MVAWTNEVVKCFPVIVENEGNGCWGGLNGALSGVASGKSPPSTTLTQRSLATRVAGRPMFERVSERIGRFLDSGHCASKKEPRQPQGCRGSREFAARIRRRNGSRSGSGGWCRQSCC